ncbi:MAG: hypothetical protein KUL88_15460 [Rhizobium sp.]|nr:hypothetical protein [Rhizobium sp.]
MRNFRPDDCEVASDLFGHATSGAQDDSNDRCPTEGFPNAYAEASQASSLGKTPVPFTETDRSVAQEAKTATVPDEHHRDKPKPIEGIGAAVSSPRASEAKSTCGRFAREKPVKELAPRLMTAKELAAYLGVSLSKVWRLEKQDAAFPKPIRIMGSTRWDHQVVDSYLDSLGTSSQPDR